MSKLDKLSSLMSASMSQKEMNSINGGWLFFGTETSNCAVWVSSDGLCSGQICTEKKYFLGICYKTTEELLKDRKCVEPKN